MSDRSIAGNDTTTARNDALPYPVVEYPGSGAFIAFRPSAECALYFCECARAPFENFIDCRLTELQDSHWDVTVSNVLQYGVPDIVVDIVRTVGIDDPTDIIDVLRFEPGLCHKCNDAVPKLRFCHDMYGTKFRQNYGWYVKQQAYEYGVCNPASSTLLKDTFIEELPSDVRDRIDGTVLQDLEEKADRVEELQAKRRERKIEIDNELKEAIQEANDEFGDEVEFHEKLERTQHIRNKYESMDPLSPDEQDELDELRSELEANSEPIWEEVENAVRRAVGHYEKGNRWTSETILYQLIESRYGDEYTIERHHRPDWLDGLELDIFLEEAGVGIEYQGVQHYEAVEHWGGEESLEERQGRDERTRELCAEHGVTLVEVRHDEELSEELIESKIEPVLND